MHTSKLADFNDISCFLLMLQALIHFYILEFDMYAYIFNEIFFFFDFKPVLFFSFVFAWIPNT